MKIMVTGFEPFLDNELNPTKDIIELLPPSIHGNEVVKILLPVVFDKSFEILKGYIDTVKPDILINLGLAAGRTAVTPERIAINMDHSLSPDNEGNKPSHNKINEMGKNAYFTSFDLDKIITRLQSKGIPVSISNSAGTYVCNNLMYHALEYIDQNQLEVIYGFVHVPLMDKQNSDREKFSLPLDTLLEAVIDIIKTCMY